ncbi:hypothetical protein CHS0354_016200 [Potamilus streckersoni]|uniref:Uncharacterized protein n=1 Tax=Potamilus streckersoni TaxID=2493646 RepID=A0AAE0VLK3_9BIVA|nr:hypothetical protein CHS0354_016200 [Potamilus streckersoni]
MPPGQFQACKRGVFGLRNWDIPLRRPKVLLENNTYGTLDISMKEGQKLLVKYKYAANPNSPLGSNELSIKQKDIVYFICQHPSNSHWIKVHNPEDGQEGYVPASYVMVMEEELTSLPWLQSASSSVPQEAAEWKPYKSAYVPKGKEQPASSSNSINTFYCDVCSKEFNGPIPYQVHLKSRAHNEEVNALLG